MIYWDLDGVLRLLGSYVLGQEPDVWDKKYKGKTVVQHINEHPEICLYAPESEYLPIVNEVCDHINILTNQLPSWIPWTDKWLNNHIKISYEVVYTNGPDAKFSYLGKDDILIEDYPKYQSYNQIALITRNYNKDLDVPLRISSPDELLKFLENYQ